MSLLCQLYSLYESIQEYKGACQAASSPDCTYRLDSGVHLERDLSREGGHCCCRTRCQPQLLLSKKAPVLLHCGLSSGASGQCCQFNWEDTWQPVAMAGVSG
uniref:Protein FAM89A n=1 Tax=Ursus americanus TaxID=9643 RepID=A0A452QIY5_URSAM